VHSPSEWLIELALLEELTADAWAATGQSWPPVPPPLPRSAGARTDKAGAPPPPPPQWSDLGLDRGARVGLAAAAQALGFAARGPLRWVAGVHPAAAHCLLACVEVGLRRDALSRWRRRRRRWYQEGEGEAAERRGMLTEQPPPFELASELQGDLVSAAKVVPMVSEETAIRVDSSTTIVEGEMQKEAEKEEESDDEDEEGLELDSEDEADLCAALRALSAAVRQCPWLLDPVVAAKVHLHASASSGAAATRAGGAGGGAGGGHATDAPAAAPAGASIAAAPAAAGVTETASAAAPGASTAASAAAAAAALSRSAEAALRTHLGPRHPLLLAALQNHLRLADGKAAAGGGAVAAVAKTLAV
jgi:hypothetical protein